MRVRDHATSLLLTCWGFLLTVYGSQELVCGGASVFPFGRSVAVWMPVLVRTSPRVFAILVYTCAHDAHGFNVHECWSLCFGVCVLPPEDLPTAKVLERLQFVCPTKVIGAIPSVRPDRGPIVYSKEEVRL